MSNLYWKNAANDRKWENPANWFTNAAGTTPAANAPWIDGVDSIYLGSTLMLANGVTVSPRIGPLAAVHIGTEATGECIIDNVENRNGIIHGGTFSGMSFLNYALIDGGVFGGYYFENHETINGGEFPGDGHTNYATINNGIFSSDSFTNNGEIYGGFFSGESFTNYSGIIYGGYFDGDYPVNLSSILGGEFTSNQLRNGNGGTITNGNFYGYSNVNEIGSSIDGGLFTGSGFTNYGEIMGGVFQGGGYFNANTGTIGSSENPGTAEFLGYDFTNLGQIYGGTFSGENCQNGEYGIIYDGSFINLLCSYGSTMYGGHVTGGFDSQAAIIQRCTFSGGAVYVTFESGDVCFNVSNFTTVKARVPSVDILGTGLL